MATIAQIREDIHARIRAQKEAERALAEKNEAIRISLLQNVVINMTEMAPALKTLKEICADMDALFAYVNSLVNEQLTLEQARDLDASISTFRETNQDILDFAETIEFVDEDEDQCLCEACAHAADQASPAVMPVAMAC